jgi:hypothetical protein
MRYGSYRYLTATASGLIIGTLIWFGAALLRSVATEKQAPADTTFLDLRGSLQ